MKSKNGLYAVCEVKSSKSHRAELLAFYDEVTVNSLFDDPRVVEVRIYRSYEEANDIRNLWNSILNAE